MCDIREISEVLQKKAAVELNEVPERIEADLKALKEWIEMTPYLKARTEDQFLVAFLRGCKYSLEKAKKKIDTYYSVRQVLPEMMHGRDPTDRKMLEIVRLGVGLPLPHTKTPDGPRVLLIRPGAYDANVYDLQDIMKVANMICDILLLEDDNFVIAGNTAIIDFKGVTSAHLMQLNPIMVKKLAMINQEASPLRQKSFHILNTPPGIDGVFNLFKSIMSSKNLLKIVDDAMEFFFHGSSYEALYDHIPKAILPAEYGGNGGETKDIIQYWENKLLSYKDHFAADDSYGIDESKRTVKSKHFDSLSGASGSFRKLDID